MSNLSISTAWDESKALLARDGRLFSSVALALISLPQAIIGTVFPQGLFAVLFEASDGVAVFMAFIALLFGVLGQLVIARLSLGPSTSVGEALSRAARRVPAYVGMALIVATAAFLLLIVLVVILMSAGLIPNSQAALAQSPNSMLLVLAFFFVVYLFVIARVIGIAPAVTSAERPGSFQIIRRSWELTMGHFWRLFGFVVALYVGSAVAMLGAHYSVGTVVGITLGKIAPMSASALILALTDGVLVGVIAILFTVIWARIYAQLSGREAVG